MADYLAWLGRHGHQGLERWCDSSAHSQDYGHGRREVRHLRHGWGVDASNGDGPVALRQWQGIGRALAGHWQGLRSLVMVESQRWRSTPEPETPASWAEPSRECRFYLSSLSCQAAALLKAVRGHPLGGGIENSLHWVLDAALNEDDCRIRKGHAARNMATLRHLALNLLRQDKTAKGGVKARRLRAAWDSDYLLHILCGSPP